MGISSFPGEADTASEGNKLREPLYSFGSLRAHTHTHTCVCVIRGRGQGKMSYLFYKLPLAQLKHCA